MFKKILFGCFLLVLISGCVSTPTVRREPPYVPKFDFVPLKQSPPRSADVSFALVEAHFSGYEPWTRIPPFTTFSKNMSSDFQEILIARGFTIKGPYQTRGEMTYPDKKTSDLVLTPKIEISIDVSNTIAKPILFSYPHSFKLSGTVYISGRIILSVNESLSNERMWFKSVEISHIAVPWAGETSWLASNERMIWSPVNVYKDTGFTRAVGRKLEEIYQKTLQLSWNYLDPEEMRVVKTQAEEIKKKKVY